MEEMIEVNVPPAKVWALWEQVHLRHGQAKFEAGQKGKQTFKYQILNVCQGESFSILWKTLFVRLIFTHSVKPIPKGSEIRYRVQVKGLFAWPVRWLIGEKIRSNLNLVLKAIVKELER